MGKNDNRLTLKVKQRRGQRKKRERLKKLAEAKRATRKAS